MRRIALLTALVVSAPLAAYAAPQVRVADRDDTRKDQDHDRDRDHDRNANWNRERYDRYDRSHWAKDFHGRWVMLARANDARSERQFIHVDGAGRYRKLRIEGVRGEPVIAKIGIEFSDGTNQVVDYRESLPAGAGEVIDLNGGDRRISRIMVYTDPHSRGSYAVYGS